MKYYSVMNEKNVFATLKLLIVGESGVGKSSLLMRFSKDTFREDEAATIGVDFKLKVIQYDGVCVKLAIWDTAGHERFRSLTPNFYRNADGAILVYDVTRRFTFDNLDLWLDELSIHGTKPSIVKMIVGNKIDKEVRQVSREEGAQFAEKHEALFLETSAKTNVGVENAFQDVVRQIINTTGLWDKVCAPSEVIFGPKNWDFSDSSCLC